jgi:hypothetical protein
MINEQQIIKYLTESKEIQELITLYFGAEPYTIDYFEKSREEFLYIFNRRLRLSKNRPDTGNQIENRERLKSLIENVQNSSEEKILAVGINDYKICIYVDCFLSKVFGYI